MVLLPKVNHICFFLQSWMERTQPTSLINLFPSNTLRNFKYISLIKKNQRQILLLFCIAQQLYIYKRFSLKPLPIYEFYFICYIYNTLIEYDKLRLWCLRCNDTILPASEMINRHLEIICIQMKSNENINDRSAVCIL